MGVFFPFCLSFASYHTSITSLSQTFSLSAAALPLAFTQPLIPLRAESANLFHTHTHTHNPTNKHTLTHLHTLTHKHSSASPDGLWYGTRGFNSAERTCEGKRQARGSCWHRLPLTCQLFNLKEKKSAGNTHLILLKCSAAHCGATFRRWHPGTALFIFIIFILYSETLYSLGSQHTHHRHGRWGVSVPVMQIKYQAGKFSTRLMGFGLCSPFLYGPHACLFVALLRYMGLRRRYRIMSKLSRGQRTKKCFLPSGFFPFFSSIIKNKPSKCYADHKWENCKCFSPLLYPVWINWANRHDIWWPVSSNY